MTTPLCEGKVPKRSDFVTFRRHGLPEQAVSRLHRLGASSPHANPIPVPSDEEILKGLGIEPDEDYIPEPATNLNPKVIKDWPNFAIFSEDFPLGPPGFFFNSQRTVRKVSGMNRGYLRSSAEWIKKKFVFSQHPWARHKYNELVDELERRG